MSQKMVVVETEIKNTRRKTGLLKVDELSLLHTECEMLAKRVDDNEIQATGKVRWPREIETKHVWGSSIYLSDCYSQDIG